MLKEIRCKKFFDSDEKNICVFFHDGLNVVAGTDRGSNSIGKSKFLLIIDFVYGGNDYLSLSPDVFENVGPQEIFSRFSFDGIEYCFLRKTDDPGLIFYCNDDFTLKNIPPMKLEEYRTFFLNQYHLNGLGLSFRDIVGRFMRIYQRESCDETQPLKASEKEPTRNQIIFLLKLTGNYDQISEQISLADLAKSKKTIAEKAAKLGIGFTVIGKKEYDEAKIRIADLDKEMSSLLANSEDGTVNMDSSEAIRIALLKERLGKLRAIRTKLKLRLSSLNGGDDGIRIASPKELEALHAFFPSADMKKMEDIEEFHKDLQKILKSETAEERKKTEESIDLYNNEIEELENELKESSIPSSVSASAMKAYAELKTEYDALNRKVISYDEHIRRESEAKEQTKKETVAVLSQSKNAAESINEEMRRLNGMIYGPADDSPLLSIVSDSKYDFLTPSDTGTGTNYKSLLVFDLAMINLTKLPIVCHDSFFFKQIQTQSIASLLRIYENTKKQMFISIDEISHLPKEAQDIINANIVLRLGEKENSLFGKTWHQK